MTTFSEARSQSVFRGVSEADCLRQAEADAIKGRSYGYEPESQSWSEDAGLRVLTVNYRRVGKAAAPVAAPSGAVALTPNVWAAVGAIGGLIVVAGAFLPWITITAAFVGTITRNGIDGGGDGLIAVGLGAVIALIGLSGATQNAGRVKPGLIVFGLIAIGLAVLEGNNVQNKIATLDESLRTLAAIGLGLYTIGIGGALAALAGWRIAR